jgi:drug/metabolite transporter superfamily protein YnfA
VHYLASSAALHGWLYDTFDPPNAVKALLYVLTWLVMVAGVFVLFFWAPRRRRENRWTTQDVFALAILSVLLLVWDTFLNDQLFGPVVSAIPVAGNFLNWIQLPDLPYMFIVMVAVATIRKPGTVTALIFIKRVIGEIMYATHGLNVPNWPDAIDEGIFADLFILWRGDALLSSGKAMLWDGFAIGFLRAAPNVVIGNAVLDPFLNGQIHTWASFIGTDLAGGGGVLGNGLGNGVEAAVTAPLAVAVARSLGIIYGRHGTVRRQPQPVLATATLPAGGTGTEGSPGSGAISSLAAPPPDTGGPDTAKTGAWHAAGQDGADGDRREETR